jgi:hypothetical protein
VTAAAVALDKFLIQLTEADRARMRRSAPVDLVDQFDAATAETDQLMAGIGRAHDATLGGYDYAEVPTWLRLALVDTWHGFTTGTIDTCTHQPVVSRPEPVVAAVWRPNLIACAACIHLTRAVGVVDRTCDECGRVCAGLPGDGIHPCSISFGPLLYFYGLCRGCFTEAAL